MCVIPDALHLIMCVIEQVIISILFDDIISLLIYRGVYNIYRIICVHTLYIYIYIYIYKR
jgi:hypothetical protein